VDCKQKEGRSEVREASHKTQVKKLKIQTYLASIDFLVLVELFLDFFEREVTTVDPPFTLAHESVYALHGVNLGVGVGQESHVEAFLVDTHAQNTILSEIDVFIIEHGLVTLRVDFYASVV
jgi:hypothetical protein